MAFPQTILPIRVEIYVNSVWTNITGYTQSRDDIVITRGLSDEAASNEPATMTLSLNNRDGRFSPRNPTGPYYGLIGRNTPIRCSITGSGYAQVTQQTGTTVGTCYVSAPDSAATSVTGDIDIRFDANLTSWRDGAELVTKWDEPNQYSYALTIASGTSRVVLWWSDVGNVLLGLSSSVPVPVATGRLAIRATMDVDNGSGQHVITFYTSDTINGTWTQLGAQGVLAGTTSVFDGTAPTRILDNPNSFFSSTVIHGRVYGAEVRNGINGTVVSKPDFTVLSTGTTSFTDSFSNTWTVNSSSGSLAVVAADPRFIGEVTSWPQMWDTSGKDVWAPIECADITRRLGQGSQPLQSPIYQANFNNPLLITYWPGEDGSTSTVVSSALVNQAPMRVSGSVTPSTDTSFLGSKPLLQFSGAALTGAVPSYTSTGSIQARMLIDIPTGGTVNNASLVRITNTGTAPVWELTYGTGGTLTLTAKNADGTTISVVASGVAFAMNGRPVLLSVELSNSGSSVNWQYGTLAVGDGVAGVISGTLASVQVGRATKLDYNITKNMMDVGAGHFTLETAITSLYTIGQPVLSGFAGETAGARISRLCANQMIPFQAAGYHSASTLMGAQPIDTFLNLVQDAVTTDGGQLYTPKDWTALGYLPSAALYGQPADVTLDVSQHQMSSLQPIEDDQNLRNDVTVTRNGGSSYRATQASGTLSTQSPPNGVGTYDTALTLNLYTDSQLADQAGWRVRVGTVDEARYPVILLDLSSYELSGMTGTLSALDIGSRLVITNPPAWLPPDNISQAVIGYVERLSQYTWSLALNCRPSVPFDTAGIYGTSYQGSRYSPDSSTLAAGYTSSATSFSVNSSPLWTTTDVPFDILVAGERITVTAVSGTSSPQTFTVTRSMNAVSKAQVSGANVALFSPAYYVL